MTHVRLASLLLAMVIAVSSWAITATADDGSLARIQERGELRHLGIRYANFVTADGDGLEPDVVRLFAERIGVTYVFVESDWARIIGDVLGREIRREGGEVSLGAAIERRGDLIATGMTVLPWREEVLAFSRPTFPTQIWLVADAGSSLQPVQPTRDLDADIAATRSLLADRSVLSKPNTCLAPELYQLDETGAHVVTFDDQLKFMAPAVLAGHAETTILDVPDALVALRSYPGRIKVLGPISAQQHMAAAFAPADRDLRAAYDAFLAEIMADGTYLEIVDHHYPAVRTFFPDFFAPEALIR
jgi:ABC-type amino acid transport substrate-binding protein